MLQLHRCCGSWSRRPCLPVSSSRISSSVTSREAPMREAPKDLQLPKRLPEVAKLEWKKPLEIVTYPDPRLRAVNARVTVFDDTLLAFAKEMIKVMYEDDGVGLAAPQVGVNIRLMVFNPEGKEKPGNVRILVNPEIVQVSRRTGQETEGCLSFRALPGTPGVDEDLLIRANVERPLDIAVRAQDERGQEVQLQLGGPSESGLWVSRIFQHEYDHLQGILFHDRMKPGVLESIRAPLLALEEHFVTAHPGVPIQRMKPPRPVKKGFGA